MSDLGDEAKKVVKKLTGIWWPEADQGKLRQAADAYRRMAEEIEDICAAAHSAAQAVISNNSGESIEKFDEFWRRYNSGDKGWLPDTAQACRQMAEALDRYADEVEKVKRKIEEEIAIAGGVLVAGAALAVLTAGASEAAAAAASASIVAAAEAAGVALSATVADIIGSVLVGVAFGAVESATLDLAVAQPIKIAFGDQQSINFNEALEWAEGGAVGGGIAGGIGGAVRGAATLSTELEGIAPKLANGIGRLPATLDTMAGRMATGATVNAATDYLTTGHVSLVDVLTGAVGGAASTPRTRALDPRFVKQRIGEIRQEGHAPQRHLDPNETQLKQRLGTPVVDENGNVVLKDDGFVKTTDKIDPMTGTTTDGVTGKKHRCGPYATKFDTLESMVRAESALKQKALRTGGNIVELPIEQTLGPYGHRHLTGFYIDPKDPTNYIPVDFRGEPYWPYSDETPPQDNSTLPPCTPIPPRGSIRRRPNPKPWTTNSRNSLESAFALIM